MPPAETYSTRAYVFPTCCPVSISSVTAVMMLGPDPNHTNVAMTVLPSGGFSGLNSLLSSKPLCGIVPLNPHSATGVVSLARGEIRVVRFGGGAETSVQAAASSAAARKRWGLIRAPCGVSATWYVLHQRGKVRAAPLGGGGRWARPKRGCDRRNGPCDGVPQRRPAG